jgi:hypothetical protein
MSGASGEPGTADTIPTEAPAPVPSGPGAFARALGLGALAAAACAVPGGLAGSRGSGWLAPLALITGVVVGRAVRIGSGRRGGPVYQALAVALTYAAVVVAHAMAMPGLRPVAGSWPASAAGLLVLPLALGLHGVFGLALIVLGLLQASYANRRRRF